MKLLIIFVVALVALVSGQSQVNPGTQGATLININQWRQCTQEAKVEPDDVNRFKNRDFTNARDNIHCFTNCVLEKMGLIQNGDIIEKKVTEHLSQTIAAEQITPKVASCHAQARGPNKCENAFKFYVCLLNSTGNNDLFRFSEMN